MDPLWGQSLSPEVDVPGPWGRRGRGEQLPPCTQHPPDGSAGGSAGCRPLPPGQGRWEKPCPRSRNSFPRSSPAVPRVLVSSAPGLWRSGSPGTSVLLGCRRRSAVAAIARGGLLPKPTYLRARCRGTMARRVGCGLGRRHALSDCSCWRRGKEEGSFPRRAPAER